MARDIQFPPMCALCVYFYEPEDCPAGVCHSPGVGEVCNDCHKHLKSAWKELDATSGITSYMIEDGDRNNSRQKDRP